MQYYVVKSETLQSSHCLSIHVLSSIVVLNIFVFSRAKTRQSCSESLQSCHIAIGVDCECVLTTPLQSEKMTIITCPVDFDVFSGQVCSYVVGEMESEGFSKSECAPPALVSTCDFHLLLRTAKHTSRILSGA